MKIKDFGHVSFIGLLLSVLWIVLLIASMSGKGPTDTLDKAIAELSGQDIVGYLSYVNVVLLTLVITALFAGLYLYCKHSDPGLSLIGLVFIPVYCMLNLFSYLTQITIVPSLISSYEVAETASMSGFLLGYMIQSWPGSLVYLLNNLAYAILGISSIAFGLILMNRGKYARISGLLLIINAIACILGVIGIVGNIGALTPGSLVGGIFFILALIPLTVMFFKEPGN
ncbi:hypothetical protein CUJ83_03460 [Methanocella sp. CWC-04]|uniref:DUF4386 family protein n=1 Tax=Methanooceanicella nereidis TaxID=2052831 RepID=A0AAP2RBK8_9EURY|nr:hypothetical protein [Methanocella sp. CWC-04]MCD1294052.1 hypothetical protein [Methanocella sp. CWC-04]